MSSAYFIQSSADPDISAVKLVPYLPIRYLLTHVRIIIIYYFSFAQRSALAVTWWSDDRYHLRRRTTAEQAATRYQPT